MWRNRWTRTLCVRLQSSLQGLTTSNPLKPPAAPPRESTVRTIYRLELLQKEDLLELHVTGDGFLYNMVRILAGTLVDVGRGPRDMPGTDDRRSLMQRIVRQRDILRRHLDFIWQKCIMKKENFMDNRPGWDEYFMEMAVLTARRSTCLRRHVGAVIVQEKHIVATGYNGAPRGLDHCGNQGRRLSETAAGDPVRSEA